MSAQTMNSSDLHTELCTGVQTILRAMHPVKTILHAVYQLHTILKSAYRVRPAKYYACRLPTILILHAVWPCPGMAPGEKEPVIDSNNPSEKH